MRAWLDGDPVIDYEGPIGYTDELGVWVKMGLYRGRTDRAETLVVFYDEYRRSEECALVAPDLCSA